MTGSCRLLALAALLVAGAPLRVSAQCPDGSLPPCRVARPALDTARYLILPFAHREGSQSSLLDGADCAEYLSESFGRWSDVRLADRTRIYDALERRGARAPFRIGFGTGRAIARELGAGRLVMGQLWSSGDTLHLTVGVYDASSGGPPLREAKARVAANSSRAGAAFDALADSLLAADPGAFSGAGAEQTHSIAALRAYTQGARAIRNWDLAGATQHLRAALAADSDFARAYASLGQVLLWAADSTPEAMRDRAAIARRSGALLERVGPADRSLLLAQGAMFERRWPDACERYREVLQRDSLSFAAWYGLAQCNAEDPVVTRDPADSMRFVFRGSWHSAVEAYRKALLLAPSFNFTFRSSAPERLTRILPVQRFWWRGGELDHVAYYGFPELEAETLAFHAFPGATPPDRRPATQNAALARDRRILLEVAAAWADAFPREPRARRALASALEAVGDLLPTPTTQRTAVTEVRLAQRLEPRVDEQVRDAVTAVRLLVKVGDFDAARALGDSLLRAVPRRVAGMAGVAVLLGRPTLAARLVAPEDPATIVHSSVDNQPVSIPLEATRAGLALLAYASAGGPRDSVAAYERRVEDLVARLPAASRPRARSALLDAAAELVFSEMGLRPAHRSSPPGPDGTMMMQWALAHHDTASVRAILQQSRAGNEGQPAAEDSPPDGVYTDALLYLATGDTATAARTLDIPLNNLLGVHDALLDYLPLVGAFARMMALRADLAAARGETDTARRWARAVVTLWSGAEPGLRPTFTRMNKVLQPSK